MPPEMQEQGLHTHPQQQSAPHSRAPKAPAAKDTGSPGLGLALGGAGGPHVGGAGGGGGRCLGVGFRQG